MVKVTIGIDDSVWRMMEAKANLEDKTIPDAMTQIILKFIESHSKKQGYPIEKVQRR